MPRNHGDIDVDHYNNVWVVWDSGSPLITGLAEVLFTKRDSLGACLISETNVSNTYAICVCPRVAVDRSNNVQIIWRGASPSGGGVWHAKLANDGSFIVPSHMTIDGYGACDAEPQMELNKYDEICVIWDEPAIRYPQMTFSKLDSMGFPLVERVSASLPGVCTYYPGLGLDSMANVHTGFRSDSGISDRLTYTKLDRDGNILISNLFIGTGGLPTFVTDRSQNIHVVYCDPTGPGISVKYLKLDQNGNMLVGPLRLSVHEGSYIAHMAMDSLQYLHVVWSFVSGDSSGLMYTKMDTVGNFVILPMAIVYPPYCVYPYKPRLAIDKSNRIHLIWTDQRLNPGLVSDFFYKRGENEPGAEETNKIINETTKLEANPNPFRCATDIGYRITGTREKCVLRIYDKTGRLVHNLAEQVSVNDNQLIVRWDGTDNQGNRLPAGVYFVRFQSAAKWQSIPVVLLR